MGDWYTGFTKYEHSYWQPYSSCFIIHTWSYLQCDKDRRLWTNFGIFYKRGATEKQALWIGVKSLGSGSFRSYCNSIWLIIVRSRFSSPFWHAVTDQSVVIICGRTVWSARRTRWARLTAKVRLVGKLLNSGFSKSNFRL